MKQIIILLIIFLVIRFLRKRYLMGYVKKRYPESVPTGADRSGEPSSAGEEMVLDPVCDSYIPISTAITANTPSGTQYFCSTECRDKFIGA